jgi:hypothetical protein
MLKALLLTVCLVPAIALGSVEITDIRVENPAFSPNGDGVQDSSAVDFTVASDLNWVLVWVWVTDDEGRTVRTLADDEAAEPGSLAKGWDGRDSAGEPAPEGQYTFRLYARAGQDTTPTFSAGTMLDLTHPVFSTLISPNPYTPDLPMADSVVSVKVMVEASEPEDWLSAYVVTEAQPETLCTVRLDLGNTTYECTWDGRAKDDGTYPLRVELYDDAGNISAASYAIRLDTHGPSLGITDPQEGHLNLFPERAGGFATDPSGIDSLGFRFTADSQYGPVVIEASGDTLYWYVPWPDDLHTDGSYRLEILAVDSPGHTAQVSKEVVIDTEAPNAPELHPLPAVVHYPRLTVTGSCSGRDSLLLYLNSEIAMRLACPAGGTFAADLALLEGANTIQAVARDKAGNQSPPSALVTVSYIKEIGIDVPERFGPDSVIRFTLSKEADRITLRVYTLDGSYVASTAKASPDLVDEMTWDLKDSDGKDVLNGVYVMVFETAYGDGDRSVERQAVVVAR